jgi:hypothetical protein
MSSPQADEATVTLDAIITAAAAAHRDRPAIIAGWRSPRARLLAGAAWAAARGDVLTSLGLPGDPAALLAEHFRTLDAAYREVGGRLAASTGVTVDDDGKIHLTGLKAVEEPPSTVVTLDG